MGAVLLARVKVESPRVGLATEFDGCESAANDCRRLSDSRALPGSARLVVSLIVAQTFVRGCLNVLIVVAAFEVFDGGAAQSRLLDGRDRWWKDCSG